MCHLYGISGASGTIATKYTFNTPSALPKQVAIHVCGVSSKAVTCASLFHPEVILQRLQGMVDDNQRFVKLWRDIRKAKEYNCISKPFFDNISGALLKWNTNTRATNTMNTNILGVPARFAYYTGSLSKDIYSLKRLAIGSHNVYTAALQELTKPKI